MVFQSRMRTQNAGLCFWLLLLWIGNAADAAVINVWLAAGQSNMVGAGHVDDLPDGFDYTIEAVRYTQDVGIVSPEGFGPLQPRLTTNGAIRRWYGSELTFGAEMTRNTSQLGIIKFARNGTPLQTQWAVGSNLRQQFFDFASASLDELRVMGYEPRVAGMIWVHGTGDTGSLAAATNYKDDLKILVDEVRETFGSPQMQFLYNQVHQDLNRAFVSEIRQSQADYLALDPYATMINIDDLPLQSDQTHFTSFTQQVLGQRFAAVAVPEPSGLACLGLLAIVGGVQRARRQRLGPAGAS